MSEAAAQPGMGPLEAERRRQKDRRQRWQLLIITLAAIGIYVGLRLLPTGTNLSHMDFRAQGKNSIEFCDPLNPQFIPVVAAQSPVTLRVACATTPTVGRAVSAVLSLRTSSGKPVAPEDLLVVHTRPLHLMIVDPTLTDYQHVHPEPGRTAGDWTFSFTPHRAGTYRLFADFTPVATGRGLYASADVLVAPGQEATAEVTAKQGEPNAWDIEREGYRFTLRPTPAVLRARQPIDFQFAVTAIAGGRVPLGQVMGAYAHLVAFDSTRSGFAHLHPVQTDPTQAPDAEHPVLAFKLMIPSAGRYVIWAQIALAGRETFVPFWFDVVE